MAVVDNLQKFSSQKFLSFKLFVLVPIRLSYSYLASYFKCIALTFCLGDTISYIKILIIT